MQLGYLLRADTRDDDSGIIAALREHSSTDPTCSPIVVKLEPHGKRPTVSCQCDLMRKQAVNYHNWLVAPTHLVSLILIESS